MKSLRLCFITVFLMLLVASEISAQQKKKPAPAKRNQAKTPTVKTPAAKTAPAKVQASEEKRDEGDDVARVKNMITFLEYVLNTLGSSETSARDKEVLVTQSYSKIFRDGKVQVEDDLDDEREISTNKDIVAYLKDVDFFFTDVKFEFIVDEIKPGINGNEKTFYKVSLKRNLKGTTTEGKEVNNTIPRYVEINYDPVAQDLKIVSMYTHEINPKEALINWWNTLSLEWKVVFRKAIQASDSVSYDDLRRLTALTSLDISKNQFIQNLDPLSRLVALQTLNVSGTPIEDIGPVRNLTALTDADFSSTKVSDISSLKYSDKITKLNLSATGVTDIMVLQKMPALQTLDISKTGVSDISVLTPLVSLQTLSVANTPVSDLTPLQAMAQITDLDVSRSKVQVLTPLTGLKNLQNLDLDSTRVSSVASLSGDTGLRMLRINSTLVSDLNPLAKLSGLQRIYCDHAQVRRETADAFIAANPNVLVILESDDMKIWWGSIGDVWQKILAKAARIGDTPGLEELARLPSVDSINVSGNTSVKTLEPVKRLLKLRILIADHTSVQDLSPLQDHAELRYLDISSTEVTDITALRLLTHLTIIRADKSKIQNIDPLNNLASLQRLYMDETVLHDITAREFLDKNHSCLLIYKTIHLNRWWKRLPGEWKKALAAAMPDTTSTRENLHRLAELETVAIKDMPVTDLSALSEFVRIKNLSLSGTAITDLTPLRTMTTLHSLHATNGPIQKIDALIELAGLEDLDLSDTPIDDLKAIETLDNLTKFNCSGTQIRRLDHLDKLQHLDFLDCSNTKVGNLDAVAYLPLKTLKCYNTKISERAIEKFKKINTSCNVVYYR